MKLQSALFLIASTLLFSAVTGCHVSAQEYKLRQTSGMMGMNSESTIYVKGMRKRTEPGTMMGMPAQPVTIEQCDLQRTIRINDKKKLYFIEPFAKEQDEVIDEDEKPAVKTTKPAATEPKKGGIITNWYNIRDTGEREKMYGFTARHVWTYQKMKPSPDACSMKDSFIIKTDGWYIDLPKFNCPVRYRPARTSAPNEKQKPDCQDRFVTRRSGKGKLGFPLEETTTIIMGGSKETSEIKTDIGTLELTTLKLDSMLFEIPPGYTEAKSEEELQEKFDMNEMMNQYKNMNKDNENDNPAVNDQKKAGVIRIGVYEPKGDEQVQASVLQQHLVEALTGGSIEARAVASEEEARKYDCDYTLATDITRMKPAGKVGGLLKAIKNADPNAASSFNIEAGMILLRLADGTIRLQPKLDGKYEGKPDDAGKKLMDEGARQVLKELK
ncbi:MAG: hypothetical protein ACT4OJ_02765 [Bacteroidota bacterium]